MNNNISNERKKFIKKAKREKFLVFFTQIAVLISFLLLWEYLANAKIIDSFITSQPTRILKTFLNLTSNNLLTHIRVTVYETAVGFCLGTFLGFIIAIILWWSKFLAKVSEPFLVVLNSLPKVALRSYYNYMGKFWHFCYYCYGYCNFFNRNNIRNFKWLFKN